MPASIDNRWYDELGDEWWAPTGRMGLLLQLNPVRAAYFVKACGQVLHPAGALSRPLEGVHALDVGCGGGFLAEALAREGAQVSAVDHSPSTIDAARRHAMVSGLDIDYRVTDATALPYADKSFDAVVSSDFLEHVSDRLDAVVAEQVRVLRGGGMLGFETVNRTWQARVVLIWLAQRLLRVAPPRLHDARLFVRPAELAACLARHQVHLADLRGVVPRRHPLAFLLGALTTRDTGGFRLGRSQAISYIGYGINRRGNHDATPLDDRRTVPP